MRHAIKKSWLTQFWCFTKYKGVCPELADRPVVKALVTNWLFKPFRHQDVRHVAPSTDGTKYTTSTVRQNRHHRVGKCVVISLLSLICEVYAMCVGISCSFNHVLKYAACFTFFYSWFEINHDSVFITMDRKGLLYRQDDNERTQIFVMLHNYTLHLYKPKAKNINQNKQKMTAQQ